MLALEGSSQTMSRHRSVTKLRRAVEGKKDVETWGMCSPILRETNPALTTIVRSRSKESKRMNVSFRSSREKKSMTEKKLITSEALLVWFPRDRGKLSFFSFFFVFWILAIRKWKDYQFKLPYIRRHISLRCVLTAIRSSLVSS